MDCYYWIGVVCWSSSIGVFKMTPQSISQRARDLWESAKAQDGWDDSMRMAYIMGACDGMADMQEKCHPFEVTGDASFTYPMEYLNTSKAFVKYFTPEKKCETPVQALDAFILKGGR